MDQGTDVDMNSKLDRVVMKFNSVFDVNCYTWIWSWLQVARVQAPDLHTVAMTGLFQIENKIKCINTLHLAALTGVYTGGTWISYGFRLFKTMAEANIYYPTFRRTRHTRSRLQLQLNMIMRCSYMCSAVQLYQQSLRNCQLIRRRPLLTRLVPSLLFIETLSAWNFDASIGD